MNFSETFIRRPVTTTMATLLLLILGVLAFPRIATDLFPNVESPIVVVRTAYPGAAPAEIESQITKPVEDAVSGINGLKTLRSTSTDGVSTVIAEFHLEVSDKLASQEVRDKLAAIGNQFPEEARDPVIALFDPADRPVATYALVGGAPVDRLTRLVDDEFRPRIERIDGVAAVELLGPQDAEVRVELDPARLEAHRLSLSGVYRSLAEANQDLPGGRLDGDSQDLNVRSFGRFGTLEALRDFPVATPAGARVPLSALGSVERTVGERLTGAAVDGKPAVMFSVQKRSGANTIAIVHRLEGELKKMHGLLPAGVDLVPVRNGAAFIEASVEAVWDALLIGGVLAIGVLFLFLRDWRATVIGGLAIPISVVSTFTFMHVAGFSFNLLSTLALSLVVGILVDDAVVDLENIYRHMQEGAKPLEAAIKATGEIQLAVTATTLTIVAVFVPVAFMSGTVGRLFREFGLTVSFAVLLSLFVARTLTPMLSARFLKVRAAHHPDEAAWGPARGYARMLAWSLRHRPLVLGLGMLTFVGGIALTAFIPKGFMTTADRAEFNLLLELPAGAKLDQTEREAARAADALRRHPDVTHVFATVGDRPGIHKATLGVQLVERSKRKLSDRQFARIVRDELSLATTAQIKVEEIAMMGQGDESLPVYVVLRSQDGHGLEAATRAIAAGLRTAPGFVDVDTSLGEVRPELGLFVDHARAAELGVSPVQVARTSRLATTGEVVSQVTLDGLEQDLRLQAGGAYRRDPVFLSALTVPSAAGAPVRLDAVSRLEPVTSPARIDRRDRQRSASVTANVVPGVSVGEATSRAQRVVADLGLAAGIEVQFLGQADRMRETAENLRVALILAIVFIYLILATQFESFIHPLTIMLSLPLSVSGAFMGLYFGGKEIGLVAMIGLIMLMGIVTKNGILLVEFALQKQRSGLDRDQALLVAAPLRLRPILMTSTAMILGMLPIALEFGAATEFRSPMGAVVVGGLLTSTLLTLFVVPVVYSLFDQAAGFFRSRPTGPVEASAVAVAAAAVALGSAGNSQPPEVSVSPLLAAQIDQEVR